MVADRKEGDALRTQEVSLVCLVCCKEVQVLRPRKSSPRCATYGRRPGSIVFIGWRCYPFSSAAVCFFTLSKSLALCARQSSLRLYIHIRYLAIPYSFSSPL